MTHMHHPTRWADGGQTNSDGIMICPPHHARAHDQRYQMTRLPTGATDADTILPTETLTMVRLKRIRMVIPVAIPIAARNLASVRAEG